MAGLPDWTVWILAAVVVAIVVWFFWETGRSLYRTVRQVVGLIQDWPQVRRDMTEREAQSGGRYPLWYRTVRVVLILALIGFAALLVWRKFTS